MSEAIKNLPNLEAEKGLVVLDQWLRSKKGRLYALADKLCVTPTAIYHLLSGKNGKLKQITYNRVVKAVVYLAIQEALDENYIKPVYYCDREPMAGIFRRIEFIEYFKRHPYKMSEFDRLVNMKNIVQDIIDGNKKYNFFLHDAYLNFSQGKNETLYTYIDAYFKGRKKQDKLNLCYKLYEEMFPHYTRKTGYHLFWRYCFERHQIRHKRTFLMIREIVEKARQVYP